MNTLKRLILLPVGYKRFCKLTKPELTEKVVFSGLGAWSTLKAWIAIWLEIYAPDPNKPSYCVTGIEDIFSYDYGLTGKPIRSMANRIYLWNLKKGVGLSIDSDPRYGGYKIESIKLNRSSEN